MERGADVVADNEIINNDVITDPLLNPDYREISEPLTPQATQANNESYYTPQNTNYKQTKQAPLQAELSQFNGNKPDKKQGFSLPKNPLKIFFDGLKSELLKKPVSLDKQSLEDSNAMRITQCVEDKKAELKQGTCQYKPCKKSFNKKVTWQKFCSDNCRQLNHQEKTGKELPSYIREQAGQGGE